MELIYCPECQGFSSPGSKVCQQCGAAIKEEAPPLPAMPAAAPPVEEAPAQEEALAPDEEPSVPAFDAPPEVMAKVSALEAAIEKDPSSKTPYLQLSQVYAEAKRLDLAAAVLERFLEVDSNNAYVRHRLAQVTAKRDTAAPAATEKPAAQPPPPAAAPAAAPRKAPATPPPRQATSQVALAQRPAAPVIKREFQTWTSRQKTMIAAGLGVAALLFIVKVYVFPGTRRLVGGEFRAFAPAFSPTGGHVAFLLDDGQSTRLAVYDMRKGSYRPLAPIAGEEAFSWSPDGNRLAYTGSDGADDWRGSVFVVDVTTGQASKVAAGSTPVWSGSSTLIMVCSPEPPRAVSEDEPSSFSETDWAQRYCRAEVATGAVRRTSLAAGYGMAVSGSVDSVVYEQVRQDETPAASAESPNKEFEQFVDRVTAGRARNVAEGTRDLNRELEAKKYEERRRALTKNQRLPYEADVVVASLDGGSPTLLTSGGQSAFPSWTPDGRVLYATNGASGIEIWSMTAQGSDKKAMLRGVKLADPTAVQVTRDGRHVFFVSPVEGDPGLAKMMTGEEPADIHVVPVGGSKAVRLANQHPFKQRFSVSPDGKLVAYEVLQDVKLLGGARRSEIWLLRR